MSRWYIVQSSVALSNVHVSRQISTVSDCLWLISWHFRLMCGKPEAMQVKPTCTGIPSVCIETFMVSRLCIVTTGNTHIHRCRLHATRDTHTHAQRDTITETRAWHDHTRNTLLTKPYRAFPLGCNSPLQNHTRALGFHQSSKHLKPKSTGYDKLIKRNFNVLLLQVPCVYYITYNIFTTSKDHILIT